MDQASERRGWPVPDAIDMKPIAFNLKEALAVESDYRPNLLDDKHKERQPWEVSIVARDGAVQALRFLRVWFDVSHCVFFTAVTYLDVFLYQVKVEQRFLDCLMMASFFCATKKFQCEINMVKLVRVTQTNRSVGDILRMVNRIEEKLQLDLNENDHVTTCADFLLMFLNIFDYISSYWKVRLHSTELLKEEQLLTRLEVLISNCSCAFFQSSTIALALIKLELEKHLAQGLASKSFYFVGEVIQLISVVREIQYSCEIETADLMDCCNNASNVLKQYDNQEPMHHGQYSTGRSSPVDRYRFRRIKKLDTIEERNQNNP